MKKHVISMVLAILLLSLTISFTACKKADPTDEDMQILKSTYNDEDRTKEITKLLNDKGYVYLGEGIFVVDNLQMSPKSMIMGMGEKTVIKTSSPDSSAIIIGPNCTIDNLCIMGKGTSDSEGDSCGIMIDGEKSDAVGNIKLSRVKIKGFNKAGIYGFKTGYECENSVSMSDCEISGCYVGLYLGQHFEYGRYTNLLVWDNNYGCINNGGNNNFVNCTFTKNNTGFMMTADQANGGHGSCMACTFNHTNDGSGKAIYIDATKNSFTFSSCQIWFGQVEINNSKGILFCSCTLGGGQIEIGGESKHVLFESTIFQSEPVIYGDGVSLENCYLFSGESL